MVKCNVCERNFNSRRALSQHKRDKHEPARPSQSSNKGRSRGRVRNVRSNNRSFGDVNPSRVRPTPGGTVTLAGEDRVGLYTAKRSATDFISVMIVPRISPRLTNLTKAYQRIKWESVVITVTPQAPLTVSGGYVAGFIMDPDDQTVTAPQLTASQGSITKKWFESGVVNMPRKPDLLYTSSGEEMRFSSPASFWIITEGPPSQDISIVLTMRWRVRLSVPTAENYSDFNFILSGQILPKKDNYNLVYESPSKSKTEDFSYVVPSGLSTDSLHFWRVPTFIIEYSEGTGDTGTVQAHFIVYDPSDKKMYYSSGGHQKDTTNWQGDVDIQVCVPCGTVCKYSGSGNACRATTSVQHSLRSTDSEILLESLLERCLSRLKLSTKSMTHSSRNSSRSTSPSTTLKESWEKLPHV